MSQGEIYRSLSELVQAPTIKAIISTWSAAARPRPRLAIATVRGGILSPEFLGQSQLVILVDLRWFQQPTDLGRSFSLGFFGRLLCVFSIFGEEFCIIAAELFELDEEVSAVEFEAGEVLAKSEETFDELRDLLSEKSQYQTKVAEDQRLTVEDWEMHYVVNCP